MKTRKSNTLATRIADAIMSEAPEQGRDEPTGSLTVELSRKQQMGDENSLVASESEPTRAVDHVLLEDSSFDSQDSGAEILKFEKTRPATEIDLGIKASPVSDPTLKQAEGLRLAQARILDLEREVERLRRENLDLHHAGKVLQQEMEEVQRATERKSQAQTDYKKILEEERAIHRSNMKAREREIRDLKKQVEGLTGRLETDFKKIRVRERELEHRMEMMKLEHSSVVRGKDDMILDLRRRNDGIQSEADLLRAKTQDLLQKLNETEETQRRVVRALRIALSIVEGTEEDDEESGEGAA